jgi:hypothetical protein
MFVSLQPFHVVSFLIFSQTFHAVFTFPRPGDFSCDTYDAITRFIETVVMRGNAFDCNGAVSFDEAMWNALGNDKWSTSKSPAVLIWSSNGTVKMTQYMRGSPSLPWGLELPQCPSCLQQLGCDVKSRELNTSTNLEVKILHSSPSNGYKTYSAKFQCYRCNFRSGIINAPPGIEGWRPNISVNYFRCNFPPPSYTLRH